MEIIPGLNSKQSVSCSCMNHQFYISLQFCVLLTGGVNKTDFFLSCVGSVPQDACVFYFWMNCYCGTINVDILDLVCH
jgi:hypothetical protein